MTSHSIEGLSDGGLREKIARIIDPWSLKQCEWAIEQNNDAVLKSFLPARDLALARADAIIALSAAPERVDGGGMNSSSQSQPCAEKGPQPFSHDDPLSDGKGE